MLKYNIITQESRVLSVIYMAMEIGNKLKTTRKFYNFRQQEIAEMLQTSVATISNYEMNKTEPKITMLTNLANYYQISCDWLLGATKTRNKKNRHWDGFINDYKFPERLKKAREQRGISQSELGRILRIMPSNIVLYEQGKTEPSLENIVFIAKILGVTVDWLVGLED